MDVDEMEFASPKRRKLKETSPDDDRMINLRAPIDYPQYTLATRTEIPVIEASSVKSSEIIMFGHSEQDKAERAALALKKAAKDKVEIAQDNALRELAKQEDEDAKAAAKMQE